MLPAELWEGVLGAFTAAYWEAKAVKSLVVVTVVPSVEMLTMPN